MTTVTEALASMDYGPSPESTAAAFDWLRGIPLGFWREGSFIEPDLEEGADPADLVPAFGAYHNGVEHAPGAESELLEVINPANGEVLAHFTRASEAEVDMAVRAARLALPGWRGLSGHERARHLYALARQMQKHARLFAVLESLNNGKPIRESRDIDVPLAIRHFYHHAGWAELVGEEFPGQRPHGVCGQIIPWNFPLLMLAWKVAPALAAGNTVVLKPAEYTPLTARLFSQLCTAAGLPAGVVNIVYGDGETGAALVQHPGIDKIAFTGSTEVGREIRRRLAGTGKALTLELGGKSPFIVMQDADLDAAVEGVVDAIWFNQGEVCCAGSRLLVQESVKEKFLARLIRRMKTLRTGDPLDKSTDIGAVVHPEQMARIQSIVAKAREEGAELVSFGEATGCFHPPAILTGLGAANIGWTEEIFGPVAAVMSFRTPDEAVELANASRYGLSASIWSESITAAVDLAARVKAGVVWLNGTNMFDAGAGFGGMKESGFGREGGKAGMAAYLRPAPPSGDARFAPAPLGAGFGQESDPIDRTRKLYIGGKQARPDSGYSWPAHGGAAPLGSRKDIRNAVEAAAKAGGWSRVTGHARAQVLYFLAENLSARRAEFAALTSPEEVDTAIRRAFFWAARADKHDGRVQSTAQDHLTLALNEPYGVLGIVAPAEAPLLGFLSTLLPAIALGNRVVIVPSQLDPIPALELVQVLETSDIPAGVVNIVSGPVGELALTLAGHDEVAALWLFSDTETIRAAEIAAAGNLKPVWSEANARDWEGHEGQAPAFRAAATQVKTVWLPYGA